jgi:hypothetical protein
MTDRIVEFPKPFLIEVGFSGINWHESFYIKLGTSYEPYL